MPRKEKVDKLLNKELYEECKWARNAIEKNAHPEFAYDLDVFFYIEFYETLVPEDQRYSMVENGGELIQWVKKISLEKY